MNPKPFRTDVSLAVAGSSALLPFARHAPGTDDRIEAPASVVDAMAVAAR